MSFPTLHHHQHNLSVDNHPHPLRSHSSTEDILASSTQAPPTSTTTQPSTIRFARPIDNDSRRHLHDSTRGPTDVVPPLPSFPPKAATISTQEGFGDGARVGGGDGEVSLRPPLKTMVSFSSVSQVSYYSADEPILEKARVTAGGGRDWMFYGCFACLGLLNFVCDLSFAGLASALPVVSQDLGLTAVQTLWIPVSLLLSAVVAQPLFMRLSSALGCKSLLLFGIAVFIAGSILAACSHDAAILIVARSIEGFGVGAISVLTQLTLNQMSRGQGHPAHHRRILSRSASHLFWLGVAAGPIIGGACAETAGWRYIFWIQVACAVVGLVALPILLRLPYVEAGPVWRQLLKVDVLGWLLLSGSLASISIAVSLGGTGHSWSSYQISLPLILGVICLPLWCVYNRYRIETILPVSIFNSASAAAACFGAFAQGAINAAILYLIPIFLQLQGLNELVSGISLAPWTFSIVAFGLLGGAIQSLAGYRWAIWTGWGFMTLGVGLMIIFNETTSAAVYAPIGLLGGVGLGMMLPSQNTAIESAASTDDETIHAAPLHIYLTTLGQCFGVLGGSRIFLNKLCSDMLSNSYLSSNAPGYTEHAWSMVNVILDLPSEQAGLRSKLITAYTSSLRPVWVTGCAIAGLAFFLSFWFLEDHTPPRRPSLPELE